MYHRQQTDPQFDCLEVICFRVDEAIFYGIWFSDDETDGFLLEDSSVKIFDSESAAFAFLQSFSSYQKTIGLTVYDVNQIVQIIMGTRVPNPCSILDFWNIVGDLANSPGIPYEGNQRDRLTNGIYDKLFCGSNLPTINTSGRIYVPQFTQEESIRLTEILIDGIAHIRKILAE